MRLIIFTGINDSSSDQVINQPCYHTVIDLPRKRQPLNWRTIFTPRRSHQTKSPRRFKRVSTKKLYVYSIDNRSQFVLLN